MPQQKPWRPRREHVSVLAAVAFRREQVVQRLADLRAEHRLTQEQAAAKVGVNLRQWQRWEAGDSMPYPRNLDTIAERFGISIEEFFDGPTTQLDRMEALVTQLASQQERLAAAVAAIGEEVVALRREMPRRRRSA